MTTTIPVPHTEQALNWDGKPSRTIDTIYTLPTDDSNVWRELRISTHYDADRHYYYGSVMRCKVTREVHDYGTFLSSSHELFNQPLIPTTTLERNVARYSAKRLRELHEQWLASVKGDHYGIQRQIEWAEAAQ